MKKFIAIICIFGVSVSFAHGGPCKKSENGDQDCKPPQEAIEVCTGKATDSECQVTTRRGDILSGTCEYTPDEKYFACKPERGPRKEKEN